MKVGFFLSFIILKSTITIIFLLLLSCVSVEKRTNNALNIAAQNNFKSFIYQTKNFQIFSFYRGFNKENKYVSIYIEGDGRSWIDRDTISSDPTPIEPTALLLAKSNLSDDVVYLARPCQYVTDHRCNDQVWTSQQFSNAVLMSYMEVLDAIKSKYDGIKFNLVGYSGGATIALMLAANRLDVNSIRTIAGNLNHNQLSALTKTTPLHQSISSNDFIFKTKNVPQIHYYGSKDEVIPNQIYLNYLNNFAKNSCVKIVEVAGFKHTSKDWEHFWSKNQSLIPICN